MRVVLFFITSIFFISNNSSTTKWEEIPTKKGDSKFYVKLHSTTFNNNPKIWIKQVSNNLTYRKNGTTVTVTNGYSLTLEEIDCIEKKIKILTVIHYDSKDDVLNVANYTDNDDWVYVSPESIGEKFLKWACKTRPSIYE